MILHNISALGYLPKRIISVVPSQTELLYHLGLEKETIAITKFCVHPATWFKTKERIGGTKTININKVHQLKPDLIIANKEENIKEQIDQLAVDYPVLVTDIKNLEDALTMILQIGTLTGKKAIASDISKRIKQNFDQLKPAPIPVRTAFLIWQKPYMSVGGDTFIHNMLLRCGFENIFFEKTRYPETNIAELQNNNCELLLLSSEPYPFKQKHIDELRTFLPETKIILADGEFFSWYGSRLLKAPAYFNELINSISQLN